MILQRVALVVGLLIVPAVAIGAEAVDVGKVDFFERKIRPLLIDNCYECHSANTNSKGGLRVDDRNGLVVGGEHGPAIVPGRPEESRILRAVSYADEDLKMPPNKQLSAEQVADVRKWIEDGASWPAVQVPDNLGQPNPAYESLRKGHWAWQPIQETPVPTVRDAAWPTSDVDAFVLAKLEEKRLAPVADADRLTWIRRVTFDLTGLPPTLQEIDAYLGDVSPHAATSVVDRLLTSPAFGERWGRHWLDVARYGESTGSSRNLPYPHAWRYRDYVIAAFNNDKRYDQFICEQVAGDLLPANSPGERDELQIATGFLALGVKDVNQRFKVRYIMDNVDEQIDTVSRAVLAVTASCARCHDHKFDPIPTSDYYALAGIFQSTDLCAGLRNKMGGGGLDYYNTGMLIRLGGDGESFEPDAESSKKIADLKVSVANARQEFETLRGKPEGNEPGADGRPKRAVARHKLNRLEAELSALSDPVANGAKAAIGVRDGKVVGDTEIRIRGEAEKLGPAVPRGFLSVVHVPDAPTINPVQSGRLELARWLTSEQNPLTPRVIVNRVWQHLFGQGLVTSVDNFGINGDVPSYPELLDYLAVRFMHDGWSIKRLVRTLALSRTYQLSSALSPAQATDPANRFLWRHTPRRLDAEELRDAALAAADRLERSPAEASPGKDLKVIELRNNGPEARRLGDFAAASRHRSIYLPLLRGLAPRSLEVFDFAEQGMVTGRRDTTTVATQALYLLNDPFIRKQSLALAERLLAAGELDDTERVNRAYRLTLARTATPVEIERTLRYLAEYEAELSLPTVAVEAKLPNAASTATAASGSDSEAAVASKKKTAQNPDDVNRSDEALRDEVVQPASPRAAAWASFCLALLGSAEFRYLK